MKFFRKLTPQEDKEFRKWARDNYVPMSHINTAWHPVVQMECARINKERFVAKEMEVHSDT